MCPSGGVSWATVVTTSVVIGAVSAGRSIAPLTLPPYVYGTEGWEGNVSDRGPWFCSFVLVVTLVPSVPRTLPLTTLPRTCRTTCHEPSPVDLRLSATQ